MVSIDKITIVGAGAIGGTMAAYMARAGVPVHLVDANAAHVAAVRKGGLRIKAANEEFRVNVPADTPESYEGALRYVFLATKALHTEEAMRWIAPRLAEDGWVLSTQNGLNEPLIAREIGEPRTIGCFINFFADLIEDGTISYGGPGAFVIGELDGRLTERMQALRERLKHFIDPVLTTNIWGYLWSKLAYGAVLFATATTDETMADCVDHPQYRAALRKLGLEVVGLAHLRGLTLEPFDGWDPNALADGQAANTMFDGVSRMMRNNLKVRSGVWRDLAVHHRKTEIDSQYGPVLQLAQECDYRMPALKRLVQIVHELEAGSRRRELSNLESLLNA